MDKYEEFLESKVIVAEKFGVDIDKNLLSKALKPHQGLIVPWAISGGRRAIFAKFGLGKTLMQLEIAKQVIRITGKPFLICMPLGVIGEFKRDNELLQSGFELEYITDTYSVKDYELKIYLTNYERVRMGDIDPGKFGGVSFDEASILRSLETETTEYVLTHFKIIRFRFVATATPTPNDFIEILNYADFLGVVDRGHALTRFFQRDSTKAGQLTLYPGKKKEFWKWVATWAVFISKPSDLGFDDTGYDLPEIKIHEVEINVQSGETITNKNGDPVLFKDNSRSLVETNREKSKTVAHRVQKAFEIVEQNAGKRFILWHHLEAERMAIEKKFTGYDLKSVYGGQKNSLKEDLLIGFSNGEYDILSTKPSIAGSGGNYQYVCSDLIFVGIDYKFNDFIQAIHRVLRFMQKNVVNAYLVFTQNERDVLKTLFLKWKNHIELENEMTSLVREYGLNSDIIASDMKRQMFTERREVKIGKATMVNNDAVLEWRNLQDNSIHFNMSSWPFGDHYEYSDNFNDMGHNYGNKKFFEQCDFLTPHLFRTLMPGRIMAVHVKYRIRYSHQNGVCFTTIDDFSGETVAHCKKHGFHLIGKITVTTDVVRENAQTYRLTWKEQRKDGTKMGVGLPEYILIFRKPPSVPDNAYADIPVVKSEAEYDLAQWQLDAHSYWQSSGNRFLTSNEIRKSDIKRIMKVWKNYNQNEVYSFQEHLKACKDLSEASKLSKLFMTLPPISKSESVWTDINRMRTLNTNQVAKKKEKHICPLQLDIVERLINRYSNVGEIVADPFSGLFTTSYVALQMGRAAFGTELNPNYFDDGVFYVKGINYKINVPTLFDCLETEDQPDLIAQ